MTDLWHLPTTELAHLIRTREVSARDGTDAPLKRLDAGNPQINAIVAHVADGIFASGRAPVMSSTDAGFPDC
ncbi:Asp-tRNA(Asn)/Glu-tRNA(Gln) amidotransferase A subunit family amidase [Paraburkholderia sp. EB58]|uniref:hypothetical protein n=1 Tax=Paraburkholderia sp. EB58 TaxID=3035125 RepID=UPI003D218D20